MLGCWVVEGELFTNGVLEDEPAVVPYCGVFRVLCEQGGGGLEGGCGVVFGLDLDNVSATRRPRR